MDPSNVPTLEPVVARPVSLIPVGLKEAALDSVSFRAACIHFGEQVEAVERWLDNYARSISRLVGEVATFEGQINGFLQAAVPLPGLSTSIIDHDYTLFAARRFQESSAGFWGATISALRKLETGLAEPIRIFLQNELRPFKEQRRLVLETQRIYDNLSSRYYAHKKTAESSSLREDAFQLHESRKAYLKASMDFAVGAPQLRMSLDKMLVKVFFDQSKGPGLNRATLFSSSSAEMERIRGWCKEMEAGERAFRRELLTSRKQMEDDAEQKVRPSRELEDYNIANVPKGPVGMISGQAGTTKAEKQSWLNVKTFTNRTSRTIWLRRWFFIKNGIFGWLILDPDSGAVLESERIGILLLGVRAASQEERRFCFEIKTKDRTIILQADTQPDMNEWMATINAAKQKALEDPGSTDSVVGNSQALDPAFAISPPVVPEFSALGADLQADDGHERNPSTSGLAPPNPDSLVPRGSFDVASSRRSTALDEGGSGGGSSGRDRTDRLIAKLKSDRSGTSPASGGIASMISAAHGSMPIGVGLGPGYGAPTPVPESPAIGADRGPVRNLAPTRASAALGALSTLPRSTLAPSTLAISPISTDLSAIAVMVNGEQTLSTGKIGGLTGLPSGMLANVWGSSSWGYASRVERGEVSDKPQVAKVETGKDFAVAPTPAAAAANSAGDTLQLPGSRSVSGASHRKTVSLDGDGKELKRTVLTTTDYPANYPAQLKAQDAQFKLLFPNVTPDEKVVLVFRASWNAGAAGGDLREFPGRVYVTEKGVYFYSNCLGFVLVTGFRLDDVLEITAAPGRDSDFIFLHLKHEKIDFTRITIKTFLEPMRLLERRLNLLLENARAEKPDSLEELLNALLDLESERLERSSSQDSAVRETYDGTSAQSRYDARFLPGRDVGAKVNIDRSLGGPIRFGTRDSMDVKFKLPSKPVVYVPRGMDEPIVAKDFDVSPKALFHVIFGDRSAVWQVLYHERQAENIRQGPWTMVDDKSHLRRVFEYQINNNSVTDAQIIDVSNDHLCYVVTDRKFPWFLPFSKNYSLLTKIVITYLGKSRCRLAVYIAVEWTKPPILSATRTLIEHAALRTIEPDARDLLDVAIDQVRRLGAHSHTRKAVQIFGQVGQLNTVTEYGSGSSAGLDLQYRPLRQRSLLQLFFRAWGRLIGRYTNNVLSILWDGTRALLGGLSTHWILVSFLALSLLANLLYSAAESSAWWQDRRASRHLRRLGVGPDLLMNKAVSLYDLPEATVVHNSESDSLLFPDHVEDSLCYQSFEEQALDPLPEAGGFTPPPSSSSGPQAAVGTRSTNPAASRLRRTRERLGMYRHDLLVAMRVVNRVEGELVAAEWQDFVRDEARRCATVEAVLASRNESQVEGLGGIKGKLAEFCESCREVQAGLKGQERSFF